MTTRETGLLGARATKSLVVAMFIIVLSFLRCQQKDQKMWGNGGVDGEPRNCEAAYYVVGKSDGSPHVALISVQMPGIAAPRARAQLSSSSKWGASLTVNGKNEPLSEGFVVYANAKDGSLRCFAGTDRMKQLLSQGASPTKRELIELVEEGTNAEDNRIVSGGP